MVKKKVLIVEDDLIVQMAIEQSVENVGCEVCAKVDTGELAIEQAKTLSPDLVLMDINLAGKIDGIEAAVKIHTELKIPVIYITVESNELMLRKAAFANPYGYLVKPYNDNDLWITLKMALYRMYLEKRANFRKDKQFDVGGETSED